MANIPVKLSSKITIGSSVNVLGYPGNGGETITLGKGNINGTEGGYYKTDADISFGSSGGPVFNPKGELVGIATKIKGYYNTIGYFIGIEKIKQFLNEKVTGNYVYDPIKELEMVLKYKYSFSNFITDKNNTIKNGEFSNSYVKIKFPTLSNLVFNSINYDILKDSLVYIVQDKNDANSIITIGLSRIDGDLSRNREREIELSQKKYYDYLGLYNYNSVDSTARGNNKIKIANGLFDNGYTLTILYTMNNKNLLKTVMISNPKDASYKQKINYIKNNIKVNNTTGQLKENTGYYMIGDIGFQLTGGLLFLKSAIMFQMIFDTDEYNIGSIYSPFKVSESYFKKYKTFEEFENSWFEDEEYEDGYYREGEGQYMLCMDKISENSLYTTECSIFIKTDGEIWEYDIYFDYDNYGLHKNLIESFLQNSVVAKKTQKIW